MKQIILVAAFGIGAIVGGCTKENQSTNINTDIPYTTEISIPAIPGFIGDTSLPAGGLEMPSVTTELNTNTQSELAEYNTSASGVSNVYLKSMAVVIASPAHQNFDYLDSMQIYVSTTTLPRVLVAWAYDIPKGTDNLTLTTNTGADLTNYFLSGTIYVTMAARVSIVPPAGESLTVNTVFHLVANQTGQEVGAVQ